MRASLSIAAFSAVFVALFVATTTAGARQRSLPSTMHLTIDIYATGADEHAQPANIAVRAGGTVTITFRNYSGLSHTFSMPGLGISALIPARHGQRAGTSHVTFVIPYGVYEWRCLFCSGRAHPHVHAMKGKVYAIVNT